MSFVTVAAAQMGPAGTREENLRRMWTLIQEAAERGVQIVCFPELSLTAYFPRTKELSDAESYFDDETSKWLNRLQSAAKEFNVHIIVPYAEREGEKHFNSAVVFDNRGSRVGMYRKAHIPRGIPNGSGKVHNYEDHYFEPGNLGFPVFDLGITRIGIQICYDRQFPEGFRALCLAGAEIVFLATNSATYGREQRIRLWEALLRVRAFENGYFLVASAKAGMEDGVEYIGASAVISPRGEFLVRALTDRDEIVFAKLDLSEVGMSRRDFPVALVRRPDIYRLLAE